MKHDQFNLAFSYKRWTGFVSPEGNEPRPLEILKGKREAEIIIQEKGKGQRGSFSNVWLLTTTWTYHFHFGKGKIFKVGAVVILHKGLKRVWLSLSLFFSLKADLFEKSGRDKPQISLYQRFGFRLTVIGLQ